MPRQGSKLRPLFPKSRSRSWHIPPYPPVETGTFYANHGDGGTQMCSRSRIIAQVRPKSFRFLPLSKRPRRRCDHPPARNADDPSYWAASAAEQRQLQPSNSASRSLAGDDPWDRRTTGSRSRTRTSPAVFRAREGRLVTVAEDSNHIWVSSHTSHSKSVKRPGSVTHLERAAGWGGPSFRPIPGKGKLRPRRRGGRSHANERLGNLKAENFGKTWRRGPPEPPGARDSGSELIFGFRPSRMAGLRPQGLSATDA
jgi:hypothetical protein